MKYVSNMVASFEKKLAIILMFAMAVIVAAAVVFRYVFNNPLFWAGEVSIFLLIYITFIGGSLGLKYKTQASVTLITDYLPEKINKWVAVLAHIFMLLFMAILLFYCFTWIASSSVAIQRSSAILLPMWIPYAILPIGLLFATIHLISNLFDIMQNQHIDREIATNLHAAAKESEE
ncbi:TRAP transporter small permease [Mesobacillus selenatarsenatis]|uniref:TRAP-type C4-dicarboxylate transport system, small permease component n=1 Tax=Mesobacillus selenatarsenatis (strain DSM 18680 / JCM 14380 / FERM P-15431 / SF-1) TaxID=1321606 RepID=A0A0A8WZY9_MESS1|nr:TRAP transporter small permease [Mesobacillus selenatarsenatis]GAM13238.1 TRAP-type C4-dicarboxylate transport system, small permease component [Mesobacillus selenatarsenatis SF-1]